MDISDIKGKLSAGSFEFSEHAFCRTVERNISDTDIREAGSCAEIIEEYPGDKYMPSCLVLGFTNNKRPLHLQVCYSKTDMIKIITLYEPSPELWLGFRERKKP
ncbi:MAG TPA: DUF4258 domain-containing protein [Candidatus Hydrogenedentes bacterium]|nr:DUF4258 domain-containing protein [Candidatus Hydrogenedentota bacterium]HQN00561.1 DUF4258 domain-containing protein [Candidatus Hydrogenedentota bacterium]